MTGSYLATLMRKNTAARLAFLALLALLLLSAAPALASGPTSQFFSSDTSAQAVLNGTPYDMNDPAWLVNVSDQNNNTFAYKVFSGLLMLGYQTEIAVNGNSWQAPQVLALNAFQGVNGLPLSSLLSSACLAALDQQLAVREQQFAAIAPGFQLYDHMQPLLPNQISKDALAAIYTIPMQALPKYLQMSTYEEVQCINGQCVGFIQDSSGAGMGWPIDLSADFRFVGAYFDPRQTTPRLPSAAVHVDTVLHEYAHYLDGFYKVVGNPGQPKFKIVDTTGFYAIGYDLTSGSGGCFTPNSLNPGDWITKYAAQMPGYGNCAAGKFVPDEDWAESFSMYVADGRDFRAAAQQSALVAQRYNWIRDNVFYGLEYDTDLVRDTESGCNDVYLYGAVGVPAYAHCNNNYRWDFTLKPLASSIVTIPATLPSFTPQTGLEVSTQALSNTVTITGINWPSAISVSGGEYAINGGPFLSTAGTVDNRDTVTLRQTSSASYGTRTDAVLTVGGVGSSFSVTTRVPVQPTISGTPATSALTGTPYLFTPSSNAALFSLGGNLPPGLHFDTATGTLSGTPTVAGSYGPIIISALNGNLAAALPGFSIAVSVPIGSFTVTGSLTTGRMQETATPLSSGKVLVAGGYDVFQTALASAELYDPATGSWSPVAPMSVHRAEQSATLLADGRVLVAGGFDDSSNLLSSAELYDPVTGSWTTLPPMTGARAGHTATLLSDGRVLVAGGDLGALEVASAEWYDPGSNSWQAAAPLGLLRSYHSATRLKDGTVLVAGGYDDAWEITSSAELYDPVHDSWSAAPSLQQDRVLHGAVLLPDGSVLVTGGYSDDHGYLSSVERFDPVAGSWGAASPLSFARDYHTATFLNSGMVLVAGGEGPSGNLGAEVYNPAADSWTAAGPMAFPQSYHGAVPLTDGRVLLAGGSQDAGYTMAETQLFTDLVTPDYTLSFTAAGGGSLKGVTTQKTAQGGSTTAVGAIPASGYQFVNWTGSGFPASAANPLTLSSVTANLTITANFAASVNGACGISGGATLTASPGTGLCSAGAASAVAGSGPWNWSCSGSYGGTSASCSAAIQSYAVSFSAGAGGSIQGGAASQSVNFGASAEAVTAAPLPGYHFVNWTGNGAFAPTTANPLIVAGVTAPLSVTANFAADPVPVNGTCGMSNSATLTASPGSGLCLAGVASALAGSGPWNWSCSGSYGGTSASCSAAIQSYAVSFSAGAGGSIQGGAASQSVNFGASAGAVTAAPLPGYHFVNWTGSGAFATTTANPLSVAGVTAPLSVTANFAADPVPVNGACGASDGTSLASTPASNLCSAGAASAVTGSGPWSWSCAGSNGGTTASCTASVLPAPLPPPVRYTVTPDSGSGFSVTPAAPQLVGMNSSPSFSVVPAPGFGILAVSGCGGSWSGSAFTAAPVTADCAISVTAVARNATSDGQATPGIADALKVLRAVVGVAPLSATEQIRYDVAPLGPSGSPQGNGTIDLADAITILRRSVGIGSW